MKKLGSPLSKELREKYGRKTVRPVKGDGVKIVRGGFKKIEGKVSSVDARRGKIFVEGVSREKIAGGKTGAVPLDPSKVVVTSLNFADKLRRQRIERNTGAPEGGS
jgi:large subunit ribosomal protein L24